MGRLLESPDWRSPTGASMAPKRAGGGLASPAQNDGPLLIWIDRVAPERAHHLIMRFHPFHDRPTLAVRFAVVVQTVFLKIAADDDDVVGRTEAQLAEDFGLASSLRGRGVEKERSDRTRHAGQIVDHLPFGQHDQGRPWGHEAQGLD